MEWICFHKIQSLKSHLCGLCSSPRSAGTHIKLIFAFWILFYIQSIESSLLKFENQSLCKQTSESKRIPIAFIWIFVMSFIWNKHINSEKMTKRMKFSFWGVGKRGKHDSQISSFILCFPQNRLLNIGKNCFIGNFISKNVYFDVRSKWNASNIQD